MAASTGDGTGTPTGPAEDLRRLKAEYDNYRRRVRRDRLAVREIAVANVLARLLPVLDALDRARESGDVVDGFGAVADLLESELGALGLRSFGEPGEPFDPVRHLAIGYTRSFAVTGPICVELVRTGYRVGDHLIRPAEVVVAEPP
ncbi:nucleotide exchange factor GrpE [Kitasatospora sp. NPDC059571]|uniref:nucleotide exchange factor GrpE n=1 Tax=Kitasatospora sp. NPDC059571 TaxID=3346871 RepID=UPI0036A40B7C